MITFDSDIRFGLPVMTRRSCKDRVDTAGETWMVVIALIHNISFRGHGVVKGS